MAHAHEHGPDCGHDHEHQHGPDCDHGPADAPDAPAADRSAPIAPPELSVDEAERLADELADATARMAGDLAWAIGPYRERETFALAGAPVAVVFERAPNSKAKPKHRSGQLAPELLPFLVDATVRTRERIAYADGEDNPFLIALVLACFYAVESSRSGALGLGPETERRGAPRRCCDGRYLRRPRLGDAPRDRPGRGGVGRRDHRRRAARLAHLTRDPGPPPPSASGP
jgi:hypothetical protein